MQIKWTENETETKTHKLQLQFSFFVSLINSISLIYLLPFLPFSVCVNKDAYQQNSNNPLVSIFFFICSFVIRKMNVQFRKGRRRGRGEKTVLRAAKRLTQTDMIAITIRIIKRNTASVALKCSVCIAIKKRKIHTIIQFNKKL